MWKDSFYAYKDIFICLSWPFLNSGFCCAWHILNINLASELNHRLNALLSKRCKDLVILVKLFISTKNFLDSDD